MIVEQQANALPGGEDPPAPPFLQLGMPDAHAHELSAGQKEAAPGPAVLGYFFRDQERPKSAAVVELERDRLQQSRVPACQLASPDRSRPR